MLAHMDFRVYVYRFCSRAINYFMTIKHGYYLKICLISPWCVHTLNTRKKKVSSLLGPSTTPCLTVVFIMNLTLNSFHHACPIAVTVLQVPLLRTYNRFLCSQATYITGSAAHPCTASVTRSTKACNFPFNLSSFHRERGESVA